MNGHLGKLLAVGGLVLALAPAWVGAAEFRRMVVFGDSLSDPGNAFALANIHSVPPYLEFVGDKLYSTAPYAKGGHHYSNGPTWVEQLARLLKMPASAKAAFQGDSALHANYAVGGSTAWGGTDVLPQQSLNAQFDAFFADVGGAPPTDALYVFEFGGNDVRDALAAGDPEILQKAVTNIAQHIGMLYGLGARQFLVTSAPDLGLTPSVRLLDGGTPGPVSGAATFLSLGFNQGLDGALGELRAAFSDATILRLDFFAILHGLRDQGSAIGLTNVDVPCVEPGSAPFTCKDPNHYLFWDGLHPTKRVHGMVAAQAAEMLGQ